VKELDLRGLDVFEHNRSPRVQPIVRGGVLLVHNDDEKDDHPSLHVTLLLRLDSCRTR
jgi:hypothetical protein